MSIVQRDFSGHLNMDSHPYRVGARDYMDALNITRAGTYEDVGSNLVGNRIVNFVLPAGINIPVGAVEDKLRNRIIDAVWNSGGNHFFSEFDKITRTRTKILQSKTDTGGVDILNFQPLYPVTIDILHREEGDLIIFNDGYNSPGIFNRETIGTYAPNITIDLIKMAKRPPLPVPIAEYGSDAAVTNNNLRKKLYQFKYRWVYKDGFKSTWSGHSKTPLPVQGYSIVTDADQTQNNFISLQLTAGGADFEKVEIAARECIGDVYGDFGIVDTLDRADYGLNPGEAFTYKFYNDGEWQLLDPDESELLYDYVPTKANAQALINNVVVYSGITEGYNQIPRSQVNVVMSFAIKDTSPNETPVAPPNLSYTQSGTPNNSPTDHILKIYVGQYVSGGSVYHVEFITTGGQGANIEYVATNGDTRATVRQQIRDLLDAALPGNFTVQLDGSDNTAVKVEVHTVTPSPQYFGSPTVYATAPATVQGSDRAWKWNARYGFILVYYNEDGKVVGVISQKQIEGNANKMAVSTPSFTQNAANGHAPQVPVITASIGHAPPAGAKYFQFLRTPNLAASKFLQYITCKTEYDTDYIYFCIENLNRFRIDNSGFVPSYQFASGDRIRVMGSIDVAGNAFSYNNHYFADDFEILGVVTRKIKDAVPAGPDNNPPAVDQVDGQWIKVRRPDPAATPYPEYNFVEIYTPAKRATENTQVYYEFGEAYPIYTHANGQRYHAGNKQNQDATHNATFEFIDGDVYFKVRKIHDVDFKPNIMLGMMDANYSDYWQSAVNSNGRPFVVEPNARVAYHPTLTRFGLSYQQGVNFVNGLNRFYPDNKDEYKIEFGDVMKLVPWNNSLIVCQKLKIGNVPVLQQIWEDATGAETVGVTNQFLNPIRYYQGEYGVGDVPDTVACSTAAIYGWDSNRGVNWRLSQNGLEPISKSNNMNTVALKEATIRGFQYKMRGAYDNGKQEYVTSFSATNNSPAKTLVWDEKSGGYRSFVSYIPEMMCSVNGLFCTWKNGQIYTHDNPVYNNFYGVQYESYVTLVFNDLGQFKKSWRGVELVAGQKWDMPQISSNVKSSDDDNVLQTTDLIESDFEEKEGNYYASFKGDKNSLREGAPIEDGDFIKGNYLIIKIRKSAAGTTAFVFLNGVVVSYNDSPYNLK